LVTGQIADLARNMRISEDEVIETVLLQPTAVKRLIEPSEVSSVRQLPFQMPAR